MEAKEIFKKLEVYLLESEYKDLLFDCETRDGHATVHLSLGSTENSTVVKSDLGVCKNFEGCL